MSPDPTYELMRAIQGWPRAPRCPWPELSWRRLPPPDAEQAATLARIVEFVIDTPMPCAVAVSRDI